MELKFILEIIWRRKLLILMGFLVVLLTAVVGSLLMPSIYECSSKLFIQTSETSSDLLNELGIQSNQVTFESESTVEDTLEQITLNPLMEKVIAKLNLLNSDGESLEPEKLADTNFIKYKIYPHPYFEVAQVEETNLIEITASSPNREEAAQIANTVAELYIQDNLHQRQAEYHEAQLFIEDQISRTHKAYVSALEKMRDFKLNNNTADLATETQTAIDRLNSLTTDMQETIQQIADGEAKISLLKQQLEREKANRISNSVVNDNSQLQTLKSTLRTLQLDLAGLINYQSSGFQDRQEILLDSAFLETSRIDSLKNTMSDLKLTLSEQLVDKTEDHPDVKAIQNKISIVQTQVQEEIKNFIKALKQKIVKVKSEIGEELRIHKESSEKLMDLQRQLVAEKAKRESIREAIETHLQNLRLIPGKEFAKAQYDLTLKVNENLYSSLLEALYKIALAQAMELSDVKLVEPATVPEKKDVASPNMILNVILGIFLGSFFGLGLGFLAEYLDDSIKTSDDLSALGMTHLGSIPKLGKIKKVLPSIATKSSTDPLMEAYRIIRNSLTFASLDSPIKSLLITSSLAGEGKSSNTVNLGISFAKENKRVLLVDLDLRRPSLHKHFSESNSTGVTTTIVGNSNFEEAVKETGIQGLDLLTTGPVPPDPGAMIESRKMKDLLFEVTKKYDLILIDSPPVYAAFDSITLSKHADGTILIIESGKINRKDFAQVLERFAKCKIKPMGVILNKVKMRNQDYFYYYKSKYYSNRT